LPADEALPAWRENALSPLPTAERTAACCWEKEARGAADAAGIRLKNRWLPAPASLRGIEAAATDRSLKRRLLAVGATGTAPRTNETCANWARFTAIWFRNAPR
jgi:hypothetical protein